MARQFLAKLTDDFRQPLYFLRPDLNFPAYDRCRVFRCLNVIFVNHAHLVGQQMPLLETPASEVPVRVGNERHQVEAEQFLYLGPGTNEVLEPHILRRARRRGLWCSHSANLTPESIKCGNGIFKRIAYEMLCNVPLLRGSQGEQLFCNLKVLSEDGQRVVRPAVGTKRKCTVDGIDQCASVTHNICFQLLLPIPVVKPLRATGDLHADTDAEPAGRLVVELSLTHGVRQTWLEHLADYDVVPPFAQLERPVVTVKPEHRATRFGNELAGTDLNAMTFKGRAERLGWARGSVCDAGCINFYLKSFPAAGVDVFVETEGMYVGIDMYSNIKLGKVFFVRHASVQIASYVYDEPGDANDSRLVSYGEVPAIAFSEAMGDLAKISGKSEEQKSEDQHA